ncbi:MAG: FtsX-like permease family protein [Clostridia bacterium]|nr:FtsX-like permease family protein [Clostridia bacterium]
MFRLCWKKSIKDFLSSKSRTLLVLLAMIVGITGMGAVLNAQAILTREMTANYLNTNPASATLWVEALNKNIVEQVRQMPGIKYAEQRRTVPARVVSETSIGKEIYLFVISDFNDLSISTFTSEKGSWPPAKGEILIERSAVDVLKCKIGDIINVKLPDLPAAKLNITGILHAPALSPAYMEGFAYGFITPETYRMLGGKNGMNELKFVVSDNQMDKKHIRDITNKLKDWLEKQGKRVERIEIPKPGKHPHASQMETLLFLIGSFGILTLILSVIIVANMISAILSQQIRQIGIMKAVGGRPLQIASIYLTSILILGGIAIVVAIPLAVIGGRAYSNLAAEMLNFKIFDNSIPLGIYLIQVLVGLLLPLTAAVYSIIKGSFVTVREALQDYGVSLKGKHTKEVLLYKIKGISRPFLLSIRNTFRKKGRLLFTFGVLSIGGALFITAMNVSASMNSSTVGFIKSFRFDVSAMLARPYDKTDIETAVKKIPGIKYMEVWGGSQAARMHQDSMKGNNFTILAVPPDTKAIAPIQPSSGQWLKYEDTNAIVINQMVLSLEPDIKLGDTITLSINGRESDWKITGIVQEIMSEPKAYVNMEYFQNVTEQDGLGQNAVIVIDKKEAKSINNMAKIIETELESSGFQIVKVQRLADIREKVEEHLLIIASMLVIMSFLGVTVGGLGLSTTMSINILERTREIGIMRAVGASTKSIFRIILGEGIVIGLLSWVSAVLIAAPVSIFMSITFGNVFFETPLKISFSPLGIFIWLGLALILAALSSLYPAWKATKMGVREVLAYE